MNLLEELISNNLSDYPELTEYRDVVLEFISSHEKKRPDMCIEGCKALIEGLSKFICFDLSIDNNNLTKWKDLKVAQKFKEAIEILKLENYEEEFTKLNGQLVFKLGEIRNERGEISHGQAYPKNSYSDENFAKFIGLWTEGLCYFLISKYISCKQTTEDEDTDIYSTEQFEEFDCYLDSLYEDIEFISYSKALKEQDGPQYELLMDDYYKNQ
jgi:hypothetical protein